MRRSNIAALVVFLIAMAPALTQPSAAPEPASSTGISPQIQDYVVHNLHDLTVTVTKSGYNQSAGKKISDEFGLLYKLAGVGVLRYEPPNQIRIDGKIVGVPGTFVMNGTTQRVHVGSIHANMDQSQAPGRVTTLLDLGLLSDFYLSYADAHFEGAQSVDGVRCAVFRLTYPPRLHDKSERIVWIDPKTRIIMRRQEIKQDGTLRAVFLYQKPVQAAQGVWLPSLIEADNADGQKVGELGLKDIQVNKGLSASLFN